MILILLILLTIIYIQFGLFTLIQIMIWLIVFISSNVLIGLNPWNIKAHISRVLSICIVIFILWYNSQEISIQTSMLLPLSISKITFTSEFNHPIFIKFPEKRETLYLWDDQEIKEFLNSLATDENYIIFMQFKPSELDWDGPNVALSNTFLINRHSSSTTIRKFIDDCLFVIKNTHELDDYVIQPDVVGPMIELHYCEFEIIT